MSAPGAEGGDGHPLLHRRVRDIASRGEGVLTAIVHEWHGGRLLRFAYVQPATGVAWTTAVDNIGPALWREASPAEEPSEGGPDS